MSERRPPVKPLSLGGSTPATRPADADAGADVRPDVRPDARTYTPAGALAQVPAAPTSGPGAHNLATDRAHLDAQRRRRARAQREVDAAARSYTAFTIRMADKLNELMDVIAKAETAGMTLEEVRAVTVLAGLPPEFLPDSVSSTAESDR